MECKERSLYDSRLIANIANIFFVFLEKYLRDCLRHHVYARDELEK